MEGQIKQFLSYLEVEQRCSRHTVGAYGRDLRQFNAWCDSDDCSTVTPGEIRAWIGDLADGGMETATLRRKAQSLRAFFHWRQKTAGAPSNPAADIVLPKLRKHLPNFIKEEEMEALLDTSHDTFAQERAHITLAMLYSLGLRQDELLTLTDADVDYPGREVRVTGKRNKQRAVPLPDQLAEEIRHWQEVRDARYPQLERPAALIAGPHGHLSKTALYGVVRDALATVSAGRKSPHTLRHTFATSMINNGANLDAVREMLGHESLATTQIYTHLSFNELLSNYRHSHPRARKDE